jgi:hypothetical protein
MTPSPDGPDGDGRDASTGRFVVGNRAGRGNPLAARVAALRKALFDAITEEDIAAAVKALVTQAKNGDVAAIRELLDRCIGKPGRVDDDGAPEADFVIWKTYGAGAPVHEV